MTESDSIRQPLLTTVVRFALSGRVLPPVTDTLLWGDLARVSVMSRYGRQNGGSMSELLCGKDQTGRPLKGHRHAFYLPTDEDGDGQLDHLTVWIPGGMSVKEFGAIVSLNSLYAGDAVSELELAYAGHGTETNFEDASPIFRTSSTWRSLTPYVLPRHVKYRGAKSSRRVIDGPEDQIAREIAVRLEGKPGLDGITIVDRRAPLTPLIEGDSSGFRPHQFFRRRRGGSSGGGAFNFGLLFAEQVRGPLALGFGCHYGLGAFAPA